MVMSSLRSRLPPLGSLAAFEAACRHKSFSRAADELNLTQAAVSRQIRALEEHLEVRLFERRRYDVALTPEGCRFAAEVNPALAMIGDVSVSLKSGFVDELTIFAEVCLAAHCLMPRLSHFQAAHADLSIKILSSNRPFERETEQFDVALAYGTSQSASFHSEVLTPDTILAVCNPAVRGRLPKHCTAKDLAESDLIHFEQRGSDWIDWKQFLDHFKVKPARPPRLMFNTYNSALDAAIEGYGVALGWRKVVEKPLGDGRLVAVEGFEIASPDPLSAHIPSARPASEAVRMFTTWMRNEIASDPSQALSRQSL